MKTRTHLMNRRGLSRGPAIALVILLAGTTHAAHAEDDAAAEPADAPAVDAPTEGTPAVGDTSSTPAEPDGPAPVQPRPKLISAPRILPAAPRPIGMELTISSEIQGLTAARMGAVSDTASQTSVFMRASYDLTDRLGVYAGVRVFPEFTKSTNAFSAATSAVGGAIGARWSEPLTSWLAAAFELDLELLHSSTRLEIGGYSGDDGGLAFGVVPKVGLDFRLAVSPTVAIHFRPMFGYALRTSHDVSRVVVDGDHAGSTAPVNLGTTNFSGPNFSFSFGVSY